jgi:hypothetical protein
MRCDHPVEDANHVWLCQGKESPAKWILALSSIHLELQRLQTDPTLTKIIMSRLTSWQAGASPETFPNIAEPYTAILAHQDAQGWHNFFMGLPSLGWTTIQDLHYTRINNKSSGRRWLTAVIQKQWIIAWAIWDYRNKIVNDKTDGSDATQVANQVSDEYLKGPPNATMRGFFKQTLQQLLAKSFDAQTAWLHSISQARQRQDRRNSAMDQMRANFAAFFMPTATAISPT